MHRPLHFHGEHIHNNFFEGWYYKFTNNESTHTMAVIAGVYHPPHHPGHAAQQNHIHAFVMVLGLDAPSPSAYYRFPRKDFVDLGDRTPGHESAFKVRIGNSVFAHDELIIDLPASHYDRISDQELDAFYDAASQQYLQQFQNSKESQLRPLTFSLASIPVLGPDFSDWVKRHLPFASGLTEWPGMLLVYYHAPSKTLYNFSSYVPTAKLRSVKVSLDIDKGTQTVHFKATTRDHNWSEIALEANITRTIGGGTPLRTPSRSKRRMAIGVEETTTAQTTVKLWRVGSGEILVKDEGLGGGLEVEGNVKWLEDHINGA
ncbi:hypothetical protein BG005_012006 [Podila minutissima]|nr:hypothetical protein BG005_012006 [Podila minutissima]